MAVDRDALREEMEKAKTERGGAGGIRFVKKGTTSLRILEFVDPISGKTLFSRKLVEWRKLVGGKQRTLCVDRDSTWSTPDNPVPDAVGRAEELTLANGRDFPYNRSRRYLVNAIDLNNRGGWKVEPWALPSTAWDQIAAVVGSDQWSDVLEPATGHSFEITGTGDNLDREYKVTVSRNPVPVTDNGLLDSVRDPWEFIVDPGIEGQCRLIGDTPQGLFGDAWQQELERYEPMYGPSFGESVDQPAGQTPAAPARTAASAGGQSIAGGVPPRSAPSRPSVAPSGPPARQAPSVPSRTAPVPSRAAENKPAQPAAAPAGNGAGSGLLAGLATRRR